MDDQRAIAIVLAAGLGTRMRSAKPKVLHEVAGRSMLAHVLCAAEAAGLYERVVVVGPGMDNDVAAAVEAGSGETRVVVQAERRGTGHAVQTARAALGDRTGAVVVLFGDTPLIRTETIGLMMDAVSGADVVVLGFTPEDPTGYGRLISDAAGHLTAIREHIDADDEERRIGLCWSGLMAFREAGTLELLDALKPNNAQGELYLSDIVALAYDHGLTVSMAEADPVDVMGVNSRGELARAEAHMQNRLRQRAMAAGATLVAPETVFFSHDTVLGQDVVVEPNVVFAGRVAVEDGAHIRAFSHLDGAHVQSGAIVGPYTRLRPGAEIGANAHVGNFVEIKNASLGAGAKANHLTYVGDATVGERANLGAGTITCNYDGFDKHQTEIGAGAFIGSNSALIAPVTVGDGAYVASGSVVTRNVEADALAVARGRQENKPGWAAKFRDLHRRTRSKT